MLSANPTQRFFNATGPRVFVLTVVGVIAIGAVLVFQMLPTSAFSDEGVTTGIVAGLFMVMLCLALAATRACSVDYALAQRRAGFFIWWFLLISEAIFDHMGDTVRSFEGSFSPQAYGEGLIWALSFLAVVVLSVGRPGYLRELFRAQNKWLSLFAVACLVSAVFSPAQLYALAWAFKLILVILLLQLCCSAMESLDDIVVFLRITMWAFFILSAAPIAVAIAYPETAFVNGRLPDPTFLSPIAASLMLLAIILLSLKRRTSYLIAGFFGAGVMIFAFGKAGIAAGILSALLFYLLQRKLKVGAMLVIGLAVLGIAVASFTPVASYVHFYAGTQQAGSLTGRTDVWAAAAPAMRQNFLFGRGYLASYFAWAFAKNRLSTAGHLHNGFLEVMYNNGIVGLVPILVFFWVTAKNLLQSLGTASRNQRSRDQRWSQVYLLTLGCVVMFVNLFLNGLFEASFGARAVSLFMLLIAVFCLSRLLLRFSAELPEPTFHRAAMQKNPGPTIEALTI